MTVQTPSIFFLADGMGDPGLDVPIPLLLLVFAGIIALITGISRWLGARRSVAVCIPCVPLGLLFICTIGSWSAGQGGAFPMFYFTAPLLGVALVTSLVTAFVIKNKKARE